MYTPTAMQNRTPHMLQPSFWAESFAWNLLFQQQHSVFYVCSQAVDALTFNHCTSTSS